MPFKSKKQRRFMHAQHPDIADRWEHEGKTPADLPEQVGKMFGISADKLRGKMTGKAIDYDAAEMPDFSIWQQPETAKQARKEEASALENRRVQENRVNVMKFGFHGDPPKSGMRYKPRRGQTHASTDALRAPEGPMGKEVGKMTELPTQIPLNAELVGKLTGQSRGPTWEAGAMKGKAVSPTDMDGGYEEPDNQVAGMTGKMGGAGVHKYIRREPNGAGGYRYIYQAPNGGEVAKHPVEHLNEVMSPLHNRGGGVDRTPEPEAVRHALAGVKDHALSLKAGEKKELKSQIDRHLEVARTHARNIDNYQQRDRTRAPASGESVTHQHVSDARQVRDALDGAKGDVMNAGKDPEKVKAKKEASQKKNAIKYAERKHDELTQGLERHRDHKGLTMRYQHELAQHRHDYFAQHGHEINRPHPGGDEKSWSEKELGEQRQRLADQEKSDDEKKYPALMQSRRERVKQFEETHRKRFGASEQSEAEKHKEREAAGQQSMDFNKAIAAGNDAFDLMKGIARGGKYYKRTPKAGGGYNYFYTKEAYDRVHGHVGGGDATLDRKLAQFKERHAAGTSHEMDSWDLNEVAQHVYKQGDHDTLTDIRNASVKGVKAGLGGGLDSLNIKRLWDRSKRDRAAASAPKHDDFPKYGTAEEHDAAAKKARSGMGMATPAPLQSLLHQQFMHHRREAERLRGMKKSMNPNDDPTINPCALRDKNDMVQLPNDSINVPVAYELNQRMEGPRLAQLYKGQDRPVQIIADDCLVHNQGVFGSVDSASQSLCTCGTH